MRWTGRLTALLLTAFVGGAAMDTEAGAAVRPGAAEMRARDAWVRRHIDGAALPFSFSLDGRPSSELLPRWATTACRRSLPGRRTERVRTWTDPVSGLQVRLVAVTYRDCPVVEWTVWLKATGAADTGLVADLQGLDAPLTGPGAHVLHHWRGDLCTPNSYEPLQTPLGADAPARLASSGGRPSNGTLPYFRVQGPAGGVLAAVGWPGQWAASLSTQADGSVRAVAGQEATRFRLRPGEQARTPLTALLFWRGDDPVRAHNLWRRWMVDHNLPRSGGKPPRPMLSFCSGGFFEGLRVSEASERAFMDTLTANGVKLDYWWMDAGWYPCGAWWDVGTWDPDRERFPDGIRAVSDYARARGMGLVLWFEPERVTAGSWLARQHPEWVLGGALLDLGNPKARAWLIDHVSGAIAREGIGFYRQDFNMDPLEIWRANDAPDRKGMTENLHVQGYLAYWDALLQRHPGLRIDSCASGGRRNDLETMRRAVPLLRSDYQSQSGSQEHNTANQAHNYGLSWWLPYQGQGVYYGPHLAYAARSYMCAAFAMCTDVRRPGTDWDLYRKLTEEWRAVADCFLGDYYPLTPYSLADDAWMALQFSTKDGAVSAAFCYRRPGAPAARNVRLQGLDERARYRVRNLDSGAEAIRTGRSLTRDGLDVTLETVSPAGLD